MKGNSDLISEKVVIGVSTILTWAKTENEDPEQSLTEEDYRKRRPHPNYKKHLALEKMLLKKGNAMVKGYVVASGIMFGEGEYYLHSFFKDAWHGQPLPIVGDGSNLVPTIHARDVAGIVSHVISSRPEETYLVAVTSGNNSLDEIVKAISSSLGCGEVKSVTPEDAVQLCSCDIPSQQSVLLDYLGLNLKVESVVTAEMIAWKCEVY